MALLSTPTVETLALYTGRLFDTATGLQYNRARWYDASVGCWMSVDPIGFEAGDANLYRYVGNGVLWGVDPEGRCCHTCCVENLFFSFADPIPVNAGSSLFDNNLPRHACGHDFRLYAQVRLVSSLRGVPSGCTREWWEWSKTEHSPPSRSRWDTRSDGWINGTAESGNPGGYERKTHKMMQRDLARAKKLWIEEVDDATERKRREASDFLEYCNADGLYADFHSNRHTFITNMEQADISPKMAQTLARHSDIRLTLGVYTHVGRDDQRTAIESLPAPPVRKVE